MGRMPKNNMRVKAETDKGKRNARDHWTFTVYLDGEFLIDPGKDPGRWEEADWAALTHLAEVLERWAGGMWGQD